MLLSSNRITGRPRTPSAMQRAATQALLVQTRNAKLPAAYSL
jgi:hypothetical protein